MIDASEDLADRIARLTETDGVHATKVPHVCLIRSSHPTQEIHTVHEPALCLVVQGRKRVMLSDQIFDYDQSQFLMVSFDLPVTGQVVNATPDCPYLCLRLDIETTALAGLIAEIGIDENQTSEVGPGLMLGEATADILDAADRLVRLIETPQDIPILAPMLERELLYRVLRGPHAGHLRSLAFGKGQSRQVARAISWIKENYRTPFDMDEVASAASLSASALHQHFKSVTLMSPLQYQKRLRLQEARRLMLFQGEDAATAGFAVGYESPSQFSREYRRQFGAPPLRDVAYLIEKSDFAASV
ncbi:MAG: AraC family transcriptional regulator [Pseudomonadota bacterium]